MQRHCLVIWISPTCSDFWARWKSYVGESYCAPEILARLCCLQVQCQRESCKGTQRPVSASIFDSYLLHSSLYIKSKCSLFTWCIIRESSRPMQQLYSNCALSFCLVHNLVYLKKIWHSGSYFRIVWEYPFWFAIRCDVQMGIQSNDFFIFSVKDDEKKLRNGFVHNLISWKRNKLYCHGYWGAWKNIRVISIGIRSMFMYQYRVQMSRKNQRKSPCMILRTCFQPYTSNRW